MTVLISFLFFLSGLHDIHLSRTEINCNQDNQSLEVTMYIFIDDLESSLKMDGYDSLYIATNRESAEAEPTIRRYLEKHFTVYINGEKVKFNFLGKELSDDLTAIWCYLEATGIGNPTEVNVFNDVLTEQFDDQKNMILLRKNKQEKYMLLHTGKPQESVQL